MNPEPPVLNEPPKKSPTFALVLAFVPAALSMIIVGINPSKGPTFALFVVNALVSMVCCITASFMLFTSKRGWAIAIGILMMLLNFGIALSSGCLAVLSNANVH